MKALLFAFMLGGVLLLGMSLANLVGRGGKSLAARNDTFCGTLDFLTLAISAACIAALVVAKTDETMWLVAAADGVFCGVVALGAALSRNSSLRDLGILVLALVTLLVGLILMAIVASLCGWDGLNMHMN